MDTKYLDRLTDALARTTFCKGETVYAYEAGIAAMIELFTEVKRFGNSVYFIGNGGSAAIASHMTADYMRNGGMNTCSLYDSALLTCIGNDFGYASIFSRPLDRVGKEDDLLVAISSSGNSENIVNAVMLAKRKHMRVLTLSGFDPHNRISRLGNLNIHVPISEYGITETLHALILQQGVDLILERDGIAG